MAPCGASCRCYTCMGIGDRAIPAERDRAAFPGSEAARGHYTD
nr:MAG TPA: hypothetical protein [Caudoviricetes sp.]